MATPDPSMTDVCHKCNEPIKQQQFIKVGAFKFHKHHFTCTVCDENLHGKKFHHKEGNFYCAIDYVNKFCHTCRQCNEKITAGSVIQAFGGYYHPEHFVCSVCAHPFRNGKYYEADNLPYCEEHYLQFQSEKCEACGQPVAEGDSVKVHGRTLHASCVKCHHCGKPLDRDVYNKDGQVWCREDYLNFFTKRCTKCGDFIVKHCISVNQENYHPECLQCDVCHVRIEKYISVGGSLRCAAHRDLPFEPFRCDVCTHLVQESEAVASCGKRVHDRCFDCSVCKTKLNKEDAKLKNNAFWCTKCCKADRTTMGGDSGHHRLQSISDHVVVGRSPAPRRRSGPQTADIVTLLSPGPPDRVLSIGSPSPSPALSPLTLNSAAGSLPSPLHSALPSPLNFHHSPVPSARRRHHSGMHEVASPSASLGTSITVQSPNGRKDSLGQLPVSWGSAGSSVVDSAASAYSASPSAPSSSLFSSPASLPRLTEEPSAFLEQPRAKRKPKIALDQIKDTGQPIKWKKGDLIGKGSFGKVYMGMNVATGGLIAVKQVRLSTTEDLIQAEQLQSEINLMEKLRHPNIVSLLGTQRQGNKLNILMEYVPGKSLDTQLSQFGGFGEKLLRSYAKQIVDALEYCHANHVVHRDIKGKNILVDTQGNLKLADFGSAKRFNNVMTAEAPSIGYNYTPLWTAPEVLTGNYNSKVDIWSLGCVIIEMATAKPPWSEQNFENPFRALYHIGNSNSLPKLPDNLSVDGLDFLTKCLTRKPEDRPSAVELGRHTWLAGLPTQKGYPIEPDLPAAVADPPQPNGASSPPSPPSSSASPSPPPLSSPASLAVASPRSAAPSSGAVSSSSSSSSSHSSAPPLSSPPASATSSQSYAAAASAHLVSPSVNGSAAPPSQPHQNHHATTTNNDHLSGYESDGDIVV